MTNKKILLGGLLVLLIFFSIGVLWINSQPVEEEYTFPSPEEVVEQYFNSWNKKNYVDMYATFSDGFKKIEPTAENLRTFKEYVDSQEVTGVEITNIKETSNDESTATVDYEVIFDKKGSYIPFKGTFTLKYKKGDIIQGWKLIHPYGENIDE